MNYQRKKSGWKYYTKINPNLDKPNDPLSRAFDKFIGELLIDEKHLKDVVEKKLIINTANENNNIVIRSNGVDHIFFKDKFLVTKKFRQKLIDYYNNHDMFVNGPKEISFINGTRSNTWVISLNKMNSRNSE